VGASADPDLDELCRIAAEASRGRGHELGDWTDDAAGGSARHARCATCGRIAYVRVGEGMTGLAGDALRERCGDGPASAAPGGRAVPSSDH
jgi:hypothetical protein